MSKSAKEAKWQYLGGEKGNIKAPTCRPVEFPPLADSPTANHVPALNLAPASVKYSTSRNIDQEKSVFFYNSLKQLQNSFHAGLSPPCVRK